MTALYHELASQACRPFVSVAGCWFAASRIDRTGPQNLVGAIKIAQAPVLVARCPPPPLSMSTVPCFALIDVHLLLLVMVDGEYAGSYDPASGEVRVLLGTELRKNKAVINTLSGKREDTDAGPEHTAWREFWEESGKVNPALHPSEVSSFPITEACSGPDSSALVAIPNGRARVVC